MIKIKHWEPELYDEDDEFRFLEIKKRNEVITRIDKRYIRRYYDTYDKKFKRIRLSDMIWYPSQYYMDEIDRMPDYIPEKKELTNDLIELFGEGVINVPKKKAIIIKVKLR